MDQEIHVQQLRFVEEALVVHQVVVVVVFEVVIEVVVVVVVVVWWVARLFVVVGTFVVLEGQWLDLYLQKR